MEVEVVLLDDDVGEIDVVDDAVVVVAAAGVHVNFA